MAYVEWHKQCWHDKHGGILKTGGQPIAFNIVFSACLYQGAIILTEHINATKAHYATIVHNHNKQQPIINKTLYYSKLHMNYTSIRKNCNFTSNRNHINKK